MSPKRISPHLVSDGGFFFGFFVLIFPRYNIFTEKQEIQTMTRVDLTGWRERETLTLPETADILTYTAQTLRQKAINGEVPGAFQIGSHWRFAVPAIRRLLGEDPDTDIEIGTVNLVMPEEDKS